MSRKNRDEREERKQLDRIEHKLDKDIALDKQILAGQGGGNKAAQSLQLSQIGGNMGVITGIKAGATGSFALSTLPAGSLLQAGSIPSYASDNEVDVSALSVAADGMSFSVSAAPNFTAGVASFNVTAKAVSLDGTALSKVFNIPLIPAVVVGVPATDLDLNQTS